MRRPATLALSGLVLGAGLLCCPDANADTSAWMSINGGAFVLKQGADGEFSTDAAMPFDVGVGTSPDGNFILGGLFRVTPLFDNGADLSLMARAATHGFQSGDFGLALDLGAYARTWGPGSSGFHGDVVLGGPLGLQLTLQGMVGTDEVLAFGAVAGVDLLRLTVFRQSLLDVWPNPSPAQQSPRELGQSNGTPYPSFATPGTTFSF